MTDRPAPDERAPDRAADAEPDTEPDTEPSASPPGTGGGGPPRLVPIPVRRLL